MRYVYNFVIWLYWQVAKLLALFGNEKIRLFVEGRKNWEQNLASKVEQGARYIWFHVASLGEFEQGRPVMERIKAEHPDVKILLTFFSPSGYEIRKNYAGADVICYLPMDTMSNARKLVDMFNPEVAVFVKYEYWINYLTELNKRNIPVYMISAIFLPTQAFFKWWGGWYRGVLKCFKHLFVQDAQSVDLLKSIGVTNVTACGDTRFDRVLAISKTAKQLPVVEAFKHGEKPMLIAGSSWPKDEEILAAYFNGKSARLIIAPHEIHESHVKEIISRFPQKKCVRYTQTNEVEAASADVLIIDCIGLLSSIYQYGEFGYIGGGFGVGIHNILEAAVYGMPVAFGPNYKKFREAVEMEKANAAFHIEDADQLALLLDSMFAADGERLAKTSEIARDFVAANCGATDAILAALKI